MSNRYKMYTFEDNVKIVRNAPLYDQFNRKVDLAMNRLNLMSNGKYVFERDYCKEEGWREGIYKHFDENQVTCVLGEAGSGKTEVCMDYLATKADEFPVYIFTQTNRQAGVCRRKFKKARERLGLSYSDDLVEVKNNFILGGNVRKFLYHEIPLNAIVLIDEAGYIDYDNGAGRAIENTIKRGIKTIVCGDLTQAGISS